MNTIDEKTVQEHLAQLPQNLQNAARSGEITKVVEEVFPASVFSEESRTKLKNATVRVLAGLAHPKDFIREVRNIEGVDESEDAEGIADEINRRIFRPVRSELMGLYGIKEEEPVEQNPADGMAPQAIAPEAIHSTIAVPTLPPSPRASDARKPLDAELEEDIGLRKQFEAVKAVETKKPLSAELEESLWNRKPTSGTATLPTPPAPPRPPAPPHGPSSEPRPEPPAFAPRPASPAFTPPPRVPPPPIRPATPRPVTRENLWSPETTEQTSRPISLEPEGTKGVPLTGHAPAEPDNEEVLDREQILRGIENPTNINESSSRRGTPPPAQTNKYNTDPYREPLE